MDFPVANPRQIHARFLSLGGAVLLGLGALLVALLFGAYAAADGSAIQRLALWLLTLGFFLYLIDSLTESLRFQSQTVRFASLFRRPPPTDVRPAKEILLVHEGLNMEHGIESLLFRMQDGSVKRLALGPLWVRRELEAFLHEIETEMHERKLVEEAR